MIRFIYFIFLLGIGLFVNAQCALCPPDDGGGGGGDPIGDPIGGGGGGSGGGSGGGGGGGGVVGVEVDFTGLTDAFQNGEYNYNVITTGVVFSHNNSTYTVSSGQIISTSTNMVRVKWTNIGPHWVQVTTRVNGTYYTKRVNVQVTGHLYPGSIAASTATSFCSSTNPGNITNATSASGGYEAVVYQWLRYTGSNSTTQFVGSNGGLIEHGAWTPASGSNTGSTYNPPNISSKTTYVRKALSGGQIKYSNAITYNKSIPTAVGNISGPPSRCGTGSSNFSIPNPTGKVKYWRKRYQNGSGAWQGWTTISNSDVNSVSTSLSQWSGGPRTWQIQVKVQSGVCSAIWRSHYVTVYPQPTETTVSINTAPTVCAGTAVTFTSSTIYDKWFTVETGGNAFHTGNAYTAAINSNTTYYVAGGSTNCGVTGTRTPVTVNVYSGIDAGTISQPVEVVNPGEIPATISGTSGAAGGGFTYQWKWKPAGIAVFTNIPGATSQNLTLTDGLDVNTQFKRMVISTACGTELSSNTVYVDVNRLPGVIADDQIICEDERPVAFTSVEAAKGGNGSSTYIWEKRFEGGEWEFIQDANEESYNPNLELVSLLEPPLPIGTTEFRRGTAGNSGLVYSNTVSIVVHGYPDMPSNLLLDYTFEGLHSSLSFPGVTYYWQSVEGGDDDTKPANTHYQTAVGTYFLRARTDSDCWGDERVIHFNAAEPTAVTAEGLSHKAILIDWEGTETDEAYIVYRSLSPDGGFTPAITVAAPQTHYLDDNLEMGTTYYYRVQSTVGEQRSAARPVVSATTASEITAINYITHKPAYNGNITGIRWRGAKEENEQVSTYSYDGLNRLSTSYYAQKGMTNFNQNVGLYSVPEIKYDHNGNILHLSRQGIDPAGNADIIDQLNYDYGNGTAGSNQLLFVSDSKGEAGFKDGSNGGYDYAYDANGNMVKDRNKEIDSIYYNHLNLPVIVDFAASGDSIRYLYDAAGIKLQQKVFEGGILMKTTDYIGEFIYETEGENERKLQLIQHEEGRIVPKSPLEGGSGGVAYDYQYHLKDHLGNVRVTFSTTPENYTRTATYEDNKLNEENDDFGNVDVNRVLHPSASNSGKATRLNSATPAGTYAVISVDKGDTVSLSVSAYYQGGSGYSNSISEAALLQSLQDAFGSSAVLSAEGFSPAQINTGVAAAVAAMGVGQSDDDQVPGAYLNYMVFDESMNYLGIAGFTQVSSAAQMNEEVLSLNEIIAEQKGFLIAYISNESNSDDFVYFDDFTVYHGKTNVVSTQDYYPFGLTFNESMRTASTLQRFKFGGKEDLESWDVLDFGFRTYDPTIGRWNGIDALAENSISITPYHYVNNNPIAYIDPNGLDWFYYKRDGDDDASWNWHDGSTYDRTYSYTDKNGEKQTKTETIDGVQAVVVFEGFTKEFLGQKDNHSSGSKNKSNQYLDGKGTISAKVTVYGPDGENDISTYIGYTNSSDPSAFGVVENGTYDGKYVNPGKSGSLASNWYVKGNEDGEVRARFGVNNAFPERDYLEGVYIHSHNNDGWSGTYTDGTYKGISQGCLLIARSQWADFNNQMAGVTNFKVQIKRSIHPVTSYQFMKKALPKTDGKR